MSIKNILNKLIWFHSFEFGNMFLPFTVIALQREFKSCGSKWVDALDSDAIEQQEGQLINTYTANQLLIINKQRFLATAV